MLRRHVGFEADTFRLTDRRLTDCAMVFEQIEMNILGKFMYIYSKSNIFPNLFHWV